MKPVRKLGEVNLTSNDLDQLAKSKIQSIASFFSGTKEQRVAVLGAFDTWPYMDFVSRLLAEYNYVAVTSRWMYRKIGKNLLRFNIQEHPDYGSNDFLSALLDQVIVSCKYAVINFSVSAAHFIETDWCYHKGKRALGIAYVRSAFNPFESGCDCLSTRETPVGEYSECTASTERTAWECIRESGFCPFIEQGISKNVLEYFFRSNQMKIVAVENIGILPYVVQNEFSELTSPTSMIIKPFIVKRHESVFKKQPISLILAVDSLLRNDVFDRASKIKLLTLAETMIGVNTNKLPESEAIKSTKYIKMLRKGYVDEGAIFDSSTEESSSMCCDELVRIGFLERKEIEYRPRQIARLVRLSNAGKKFIDFLEGLTSSVS